jgi:Cu2+-exporting ATPase
VTSSCAHCELPIPEGRALLEEGAGGETLAFCCPSCLAVHRILRASSLSSFYDRRRGWTAGPVERVPVAPEPFLAAARPSAPPGGGEAAAEGGEMEMTLTVGGIRCASCCWLVERYLARSPGILSARANYATGRALVRWDPARTNAAEVAGRVAELGYVPSPAGADDGTEALRRERADLLLRFGTAAFLSTQVMMFAAGLYAGHFDGIDDRWRHLLRWLSVLLAVPVLLYSGAPFARGALASIRRRAAGMDALVFLGASSALLYSAAALFTGGEIYADTASGVITLVLLGKVLEAGARLSATEAVGRLLRLSPATARRLVPGKGGEERETVAAAALCPGDVVEALPGERFAADGTILSGETEADESTLSGESLPVPKGEGSPVFAGTVNGTGRVRFSVTRAGDATTLARIARAVEEAQGRKAPVQALADRISGRFVPFVALLAAAVTLRRLLGGAPGGEALQNGVSVLVVACPCALGLATPLAVTLGTAAARSKGILLKGGDVIERAASVRSLLVDKTGTLTEGRPRLTDVLPEGIGRERFLLLCASLEAPSEHPLARAFAEEAPFPLLPAERFRARPGRGVTAVVDGAEHRLGTIPFLEEGGAAVPPAALAEAHRLSAEGKTVTALARGSLFLGIAAARDALRPGAAEAVRELADLGCPVVLLSGDRPETVERVAREAGIARWRGGATPEEKEEAVREERGSTRGGVMAVGDGVNDAPALAGADVGVAMGRGADVACESAGAVLVVAEPRLLPRLIRISRRTMAVARRNLAWAFAYNAVAIPLAAAGKLHPLAAAALMALSSLAVTASSMGLAKERGER